MQNILNLLIFAGLGTVAIIVGLGFWNMARSGDAQMSQKLMRARVIAQAIAVFLLFIGFFFFSSQG